MRATYKYNALNTRGEDVDGTVLADSETDAILKLRNVGLYSTKINIAEETLRPSHPERTYGRHPFHLSRWSIFYLGVAVVSILTYITILSLY